MPQTPSATNPPSLKDRQRTELIVIHCSATRATMDVGVQEITQWHIQRGFDTLGYHYVIRRNGELQNGRRESAIGAHVRGHNANSIGICLVGGVDDNNRPENNFSNPQFATLTELVRQLKQRYPTARILGHRDLSPDKNGDGKIPSNEFTKACPSFDVTAWLEQQDLAPQVASTT